MARIRSIKPEFFMDDELAELDPLTRLLFIGLWTQADREGRLECRPKRLKAALLPYDNCDIEAMLSDLHGMGLVVVYEAEGTRFIQVSSFTRHQCPNVKEPESTIPAPSEHDASTSLIGRERKGREGKVIARGTVPEPPRRSNFPDCLSTQAERNGRTLALSGHLLCDLEQYAGTWPSVPKNQGALGQAIRDGCPPDCPGDDAHARRCTSAWIGHARDCAAKAKKSGESFPIPLFLYHVREGAR